MFHPWSKWKPLTKLIKNVDVQEVKVHPWNSDCAIGAYEKFSNQICIPIVKFLTGKDPIPKTVEVVTAKEMRMKAADGAMIKGRMNIIFDYQITEDEIEDLSK
jgi:hypothetical protein